MVIIGVIFTICLGTFVADYHKDQTVVRLKKCYSTFENAFRRSFADNGSADSWDFTSGLSEQGSYEFFQKYLKPYLVLNSDCKNSTMKSCDYTFKELDGTEKALNSTWTRFYLNDGTFVALQARGDDRYKVIYFYIDTNGKKRLNVVARDIFLFEFWVQNDTFPEYVGNFFPFGHEYTKEQLKTATNPNNCNASESGNYCGALIMKDDWQIIQGYPWAQARYVVQ